MDALARPLPALDLWNEFFWTSGADGQLRFLRCGDCATFIHPPQPACRMCGGTDLAPQVVSGRAHVVGWTVNHQMWHPAFEPPYVIAVVAMDADPAVRLTTNLVGDDSHDLDPDTITLGMEVEVTFQQHDDVWLPLFRPVR